MPRQPVRAMRRLIAAAAVSAVLVGGSLAASPAPASAADGAPGLEFGVGAGFAIVSDWDPAAFPDGVVVIPETVTFGATTYPVTEIGPGVFQGYPDDANRLTSVTLPDTITKIWTLAFAGNARLTSINLPEGLTTIGDSAFALSGLTSLTIPSSVTTLGAAAFYSTRITSIVIPATVTSLGRDVFANSKSLASAALPSTWTSIPVGLLAGTAITAVTIPSGVTSIGADAFDRTRITTVDIPSGVVSIGRSAFAGTGLKNITIPDSVELIDHFAFYNTCPESISFGASVTRIGNAAFSCPFSIGGPQNTGHLTSVVIPASVTSIGSGAFFSNNDSLQTAKFLGDAPSVSGDSLAGASVQFCAGANGFAAPTWAGYTSSAIDCGVVATFDANDGTGRTAHQATTGSPSRLRPLPFDPHGCNVFLGWIDSGNQWYSATSSYDFAGDETFYAQWEASTVALITYEPNGGVTSTLGTGGFCGDLLPEPTPPTKTGYTFGGWFEDAALTSQWDFAHDTLGPHRYTLYAKWTPDATYGITYGGLLGASNDQNPASYTIDDVVELEGPGARTGYEFSGWTGTGLTVPTNPVFFGPAATGNRTFTANWAPISYGIAYDLGGGSIDSPANPTGYTIESSAITLTNPTREGYTFAGWTGTDLSSATTSVTIPSGSTGARNYTATWSINSYLAAFDSAGGSAVDDALVPFGAHVPEPTEPTRTGYTFGGWFRDVAATDEWLFGTDTIGANDLTLHANWVANVYQVGFDSVGGSSVDGAPVAFGQLVPEPTAPTRTGYTFGGWFRDAGATDEWIFGTDTVGAGDVILFAKWTRIAYSITYDLGGGSAGSPANPSGFTIESAAIVLTAPTRAGHVFAGWTGTALGAPTASVTIAAGSIGNRSYTATWTRVATPVTPAAAGGGSTSTPQSPAPAPIATPSPTPSPSEPTATPSPEPASPDSPDTPDAAGDTDKPDAQWWLWALAAGLLVVLLVTGLGVFLRRR